MYFYRNLHMKNIFYLETIFIHIYYIIIQLIAKNSQISVRKNI